MKTWICILSALLVHSICISASDVINIGVLSYQIEDGKSLAEVCGFATDSLESHTGHASVIDIPAFVSHDGRQYRVYAIAEDAFRGCSHIERINLPEGLERIGQYAFSECSSLKSIHLPSTVTSIYRSFQGCSSVDTIEVDARNKVYTSAAGCNAIIEMGTGTLLTGCHRTIIPEMVSIIGNNAFARQVRLETLDIPEGVEKIGDDAFNGCISLRRIVLPETLKRIGTTAFSCTSLTDVYIPKNVEYISEGIFEGCNSLQHIVVDKRNTHYDSHDNCNAIISTNAAELVMGCKNTAIPHDVRSIAMYAFSRLTCMSRLYIPEGIDNISVAAFRGCIGINSIEVSTKNNTFDSHGNCNAIIRTANGGELILGCISTAIPEDIERIGAYAFEGTATPIVLNIPKNIKSIGEYAFHRCYNLQVLQLEEGLESLGSAAFAQCINLRSVDIPNSVKSLSDFLFMDCHYLRTVRWPGDRSKIGKRTFDGCQSVDWP